MKSMTGHGVSRGIYRGREIVAEINSINKKGLECSVQLPSELQHLELALREFIQTALSRGRINLSVSLSKSAQVQPLRINWEVLRKHHRQLVKMARELKCAEQLPLPYLLGLPGVLSEVAETDQDEGLEHKVLRLAKKALVDLVKFREREGRILMQQLLKILKKMEANVARIEKYRPVLLAGYRKNLLKRINDAGLAVSVDDERIVKEVVFFADRSDITEEIVRLRAHLAEAKRLLDSKEAVGRTFDFLLQEMNREINTIGSKANGFEISKQVIDLKTDLEKMREQVQNLE